jgi:hypothetical protein
MKILGSLTVALLSEQGTGDGIAVRTGIQEHLRAATSAGFMHGRRTVRAGCDCRRLSTGDGEVPVSFMPAAETPENEVGATLMPRQHCLYGSEKTVRIAARRELARGI